MISRAFLGKDAGSIHWSIGSLVDQDSLAHQILKLPYREKALVPASPWLSKRNPSITSMRSFKINGKTYLRIRSNKPFLLSVIYYQTNNQITYKILPYFNQQVDVSEVLSEMEHGLLQVSIVDRYGFQSSALPISL